MAFGASPLAGASRNLARSSLQPGPGSVANREMNSDRQIFFTVSYFRTSSVHVILLGRFKTLEAMIGGGTMQPMGKPDGDPAAGAAKAEMLRRRKEQQKQWQQRYRDQTKYLTARARTFVPAPSPGHFYTEADLLVDLAATVRAVKAKAALGGESGGPAPGAALASGAAGAAGAKGAASGLMYGSKVDGGTMVSGLGRSVEPMFVLANKADDQDARLACSTVRPRARLAPCAATSPSAVSASWRRAVAARSLPVARIAAARARVAHVSVGQG